MKISNKFKNISKTFLIAVTLSAVFVSCSKDEDYTPRPISAVAVIHASPTAEKLDFYVGDAQANEDDFRYTDKIDYLRIYSGDRKVSITKKGSSTAVLSENFALEPQMAYSLFIVDTFDKIKFLLIEDDVTLPERGKAKVRFVNLSPDAPALNFGIAGQDTALVTNKLFKEYSTFETIDAADKVTFEVKDKATGNLVTTLADMKIESGKVYTVWVKGLKSATTEDTKIGADIFILK